MFDLSTDYLFLCLAFILLWEHLFPREVITNINQRWKNNFSLYLLNVALKWSIFLCLSVLFNYASTPATIDLALLDYVVENKFIFIGSILILDLFNYALHRLFHHYQILWRTHLVHHSDLNLDVTTNFRHHPFEQLLTYAFYAIFIFVFKLPILALATYGITASVLQLWHHSNTMLPVRVESSLRWFFITPTLHRLHHSAYKKETNSNYGTIFSFWDRCFGTLQEFEQENTLFNYGLEYFRDEKALAFWPILKQPFEYKCGKNDSVDVAKSYELE